MIESRFGKLLVALGAVLTRPRRSASWVCAGAMTRYRVFAGQAHWYNGELPRLPLKEILPATREVEVRLPNAFDREVGTSISAEEACHVAAIARVLQAGKILEIGTFDGNSALVLASNGSPDGMVVTVDLPPDFDLKTQQASLAFADYSINLTTRSQLGRQFRENPAASRIRQVHGDSGALDWSTLGGPFELIFIDGCHSENYVESDTRNALKHLAPHGVILWHDYGMFVEVSRVVDRFARETKDMKFAAIEGTRLAMGIR
jgi:predicted O-methyltransferase YrrM